MFDIKSCLFVSSLPITDDIAIQPILKENINTRHVFRALIVTKVENENDSSNYTVSLNFHEEFTSMVCHI